MPRDDEDVLDKALLWLEEGHPTALATVVETWGSSPRPRGSQLAVRLDGLFAGSVSGGCVEGRVVEAAQASMRDGKPRLLEFGVSNDEAWEVGLACGGTVRIHVTPVVSGGARGPLGRDVLVAVNEARAARSSIVLLTPLDGDDVRIHSPGDTRLPAEVHAAACRARATDEAHVVETPRGSIFVQAWNPPLELVIVGAVHIAEPLSRIASILGYAVTILDPREAFARPERWPGVTVATDYPDEVLATRTVTHRTAIVALTHDPKIDDPALDAALKSPAFYVGALGSAKTHAARLGRLAERGFAPEALARIHGPIGLPIRARSPGEIAVAIVAQMTEVLRREAKAQ
jgi:xanthine dehydrogenase accessory factor